MNHSFAYRALLGLFAAVQLAACGGGGANGPPPAPVATVNQSTLAFGSELVGTTEAAKVVTISNRGDAPLDASGISFTGANSAMFAQTNTCAAVVAAGKSCTISISFTPTSAGAKSASLNLRTNAAASPTVALSGTGIAPPPPKFLFATAGSNIYAFAFDAAGKFSPVPGSPFAAPSGSTPGGIVISSDSKFLYSVDSVTGNLLAFMIHSDGSLSAVSGAPFAFPDPYYALVADPTVDFLYGISGVSGTVMALAIDSATGAASLTSTVPSVENVRGAAITPDGRHLYVNSVGGPEQLSEFSFNAVTGALSPVPGSPLQMDAIAEDYEPAQTIVDPTGKFLYAINAYQLEVVTQCCVVGLQIDAVSGALTPIPGIPSSEFDLGGEVVSISASGGFLIADIYPVSTSPAEMYSSVCVVGVLSIDPVTGVLTSVPGSPFSNLCGQTIADPTEPFVYIGGDTCSIVTEYILNETTGSLTPLDEVSLSGECVSSMALMQ